jgi:Tfp pilus assembly protein PilN
MDSHTPSVNLLKSKGNNFLDKFISWALTIGRMMIILTETIALVAFLYRFVLDRQLIDQKDRINQKAAQIKLYEGSEKNYRNLQNRLALISQLQNQSVGQTTLLSDIVNNTPKGVTFNTLAVSLQGIHIEANVQSVAALTTLVNKLKQNPNVTSVSIDKIENKTLDATIAVGISAKLRTKQNEVSQ